MPGWKTSTLEKPQITVNGDEILRVVDDPDGDPTTGSVSINQIKDYVNVAIGGPYLTEVEAAAQYQPVDSDLTAIAALTTTTYGRSLLALANAAALAAEVDTFFLTPTEGNAAYQPLDGDLTAIATLSTTSFGRDVLTRANAAALATYAGVGTGDSPQFTAVNIGHASDTTLSRVSAGRAQIEARKVAFEYGINPRDPEYGAAGDGTTNDTAAITAVDALTGPKYMPAGFYDTTLAATDLDGPYWGHGQIRDVGDNERAPWFSAIKAAPSSFGTHSSVDTAFGGDISRVQLAIEHRITGAATLGQPSSGYTYTPEAYAIYGWLYNESGHNQSTSTNDGRTASVFQRVQVYQTGQGDAVAYNASVYVEDTKASSTSFLANPAGVIINGDMTAGADGVYLNAGEFYLDDAGNDVAGIGWVINLDRNDATGAKNAWWAGYRAQSVGSVAAGSAFSLSGAFSYGFDASQATVTAAFVKAADQRFYGNATADSTGLGRFPNSLGTSYLTFSSSLGAWHFVTANASALQIYSTQVIVPSIPLNINASVLQVSGTQVVGARDTGWAAMTGSTNKASSYDTATVTLPQLAGRVMALQAALTTHGLLGA